MKYIKLYENKEYESIPYDTIHIDSLFSENEINKIIFFISNITNIMDYSIIDNRIRFEIYIDNINTRLVTNLNIIVFLIIKIPDDYYLLCVDYNFKYKCDQINGLKNCIISNIKDYKKIKIKNEGIEKFNNFKSIDIHYDNKDDSLTNLEFNKISNIVRNIFSCDVHLDKTGCLFFSIEKVVSLYEKNFMICIVKQKDDYFNVTFDYTYKYSCDQMSGLKNCLLFLNSLGAESYDKDFIKN